MNKATVLSRGIEALASAAEKLHAAQGGRDYQETAQALRALASLSSSRFNSVASERASSEVDRIAWNWSQDAKRASYSPEEGQ
jgi:hypothetical protein